MYNSNIKVLKSSAQEWFEGGAPLPLRGTAYLFRLSTALDAPPWRRGGGRLAQVGGRGLCQVQGYLAYKKPPPPPRTPLTP